MYYNILHIFGFIFFKSNCLPYKQPELLRLNDYISTVMNDQNQKASKKLPGENLGIVEDVPQII